MHRIWRPLLNAVCCCAIMHELRALFAQAMQKPKAITYCGGGIAATSVALALAMLGHKSVKVYDASLTEWAADAELPMEK